MTTAQTRIERFKQVPQDEKMWQNLYRQNQQEYIRRRLRAIKNLWEGKSQTEVCAEIECTYATLGRWIDTIIGQGLRELVKPRTVNREQKLDPEQKQEVRRMLLADQPKDWDIDRYIWTGEILCQVIKTRWEIDISDSRLYEILSELGLSFQRAHRDYENADKEKQKEYVEMLKKRSKRWG